MRKVMVCGSSKILESAGSYVGGGREPAARTAASFGSPPVFTSVRGAQSRERVIISSYERFTSRRSSHLA